MKKNNLTTLEEVKNDGKVIAFIKGNRTLASSNVKGKFKSLSECKTNLVPMMVVEGKKAVQDGCSLVLPDGKDIANGDAEKYLAIVDGQHRYKAAMELIEAGEMTEDSIRFYLDYSGIDTKKLLAITNTESNKWKSADYAKGATLFKPDDEIASFVNEYMEKGFSSISTLSIYIFGDKGVLTTKRLGELMNETDVKYKKDAHLNIAKKVLPLLLEKFDVKFVKTRYCADAFNNELTKVGVDNYEKVISAIKNLTKDDVSEIDKVKGEEKQRKFQTLLRDIIDRKQQGIIEGYH